jgi:hypothetical protein
MPDDRTYQLRRGDAENSCLGEPPDLGPLRVVAEREELAEAASRLGDGFVRPMTADDPLVSLARDVAHALTEAGFTLHHCNPGHPLYRLGGVCLLLVARGYDPNGTGGVVVSWTTHNLLSLDWDRWNEYRGTQEVMNSALAEVLDVLGYARSPFGQGGAWIVTGRLAGQFEAGR